MDLKFNSPDVKVLQGIMQSPCSKIHHYRNSNAVLGQFVAARRMLTQVKRGAVTSLPETFFLTLSDNLGNLPSVHVQF